jgi:Icc-related predicted phosphoesterase
MSNFRIIQISDLHGNKSFIKSIAGEIESADLVALSGDLTHFGGKRAAAEIVDAVLKLNSSVVAVAGNCDRHGVREYLDKTGISVDGIIREIDGLHVCGVGGSLSCPVPMPYQLSEDDFADRFNILLGKETPLEIAIIHQPPINSAADRVSTGAHVGSNSVRDFIERSGAILCLTGHIHESVGVDVVGQAKVVNPGPARHGCYAVVELVERSASVELKTTDS